MFIGVPCGNSYMEDKRYNIAKWCFTLYHNTRHTRSKLKLRGDILSPCQTNQPTLLPYSTTWYQGVEPKSKQTNRKFSNKPGEYLISHYSLEWMFNGPWLLKINKSWIISNSQQYYASETQSWNWRWCFVSGHYCKENIPWNFIDNTTQVEVIVLEKYDEIEQYKNTPQEKCSTRSCFVWQIMPKWTTKIFICDTNPGRKIHQKIKR